MSDALQLAIVGGVIVGAGAYLLRRWLRPGRTCDACPVEPPAPRLIQLGRRRPTSPPAAAPRRPSAS